MKKINLLFLLAFSGFACSNSDQMSFSSPDEKIVTTLKISEAGVIELEAVIHVDGKQIVALEPSRLGLSREDADFSRDMRLLSASDPLLKQESYSLVTGKQREITYEANQTILSFENTDGKLMEIELMLFNDAVAYRYRFPENDDNTYLVTEEYSSFNLPDEGTCWSQAYDTVSKWTPAYETYYERSMKIGTSAPAGKNGWSFPCTFNTNNIWVLISETNLDGTYPAMHLQAECDKGVYRVRWPEESECFGEYSNKASFTLPWASPWRVAVMGESAANIIESTVITDLADPSKIEDTSWIKPGRAAWSWWSDSPSPQYVKEQNRFTDLAVKMGWEYNLIDANWDAMKDGKVTDAIAYANERNIGILLWYNSGGAHNVVEEGPRDLMWDPDIRFAEFQKISSWGVKGVKVDFFQSDKQAIIQQYLGIMKDAAANHVMTNFHGCTLPRGWQRTWPNMVSLEAVRGAEVYKFGKNYPEYAPWHNTVLAFTRNVVGPMDYTPVIFSDHTYPHLSSYAHELALSVVFESGIIHMADKVEAYMNLPEKARQFLMNVPSVWDETKFVSGYPGDYVVLARRNGNTWYIAGINGNSEALELSFNTNFTGLSSGQLELILDGKKDTEFAFSTHEISKDANVTISLLPYGGFVGTLAVE